MVEELEIGPSASAPTFAAAGFEREQAAALDLLQLPHRHGHYLQVAASEDHSLVRVSYLFSEGTLTALLLKRRSLVVDAVVDEVVLKALRAQERH